MNMLVSLCHANTLLLWTLCSYAWLKCSHSYPAHEDASQLESDYASIYFEDDYENDTELNNIFGDELTSVRLQLPCPENCQCFIPTVALCARLNLTDIPTDRLVSTGANGQQVYSPVFPQSVTTVYLDHNDLRMIPARFMIVSGSNLRTLSLQNNNIKLIADGSFLGIDNLINLDLTNNALRNLVFEETLNGTIVFSSIFHEVKDSIENLRLSFNQITSLPAVAFAGFHHLKMLSLSNNNIAWIARRTFEDLTSLQMLELRSNPLNSATIAKMNLILSRFTVQNSTTEENHLLSGSISTSQCLNGNINMDLLTLRKKRDLAAAVKAKAKSKKTMKRRWRRNVHRVETLEILDLGNLRLKSFPNLPSSLRVLVMDGNRVTSLARSTLAKIPNLEVLQLAGNRIRSLTDGVFFNQAQLRLLDLSSNKLSYVSSFALCGLIRLESLRLYNNPDLIELPNKVFRSTRSLQALYLQDCGLRTLPEGPWLYRLASLWLYGNPLLCDCVTLAPILMTLQLHLTGNRCQKKFVLDPYRDVIWDDRDTWPGQRPDNTACVTPSRFQGFPITEVRLSDLRCSLKDLTKIWINRRLACPFSDYQDDDGSYLEHGDFFANDQDNRYDYVPYEDYTSLKSIKSVKTNINESRYPTGGHGQGVSVTPSMYDSPQISEDKNTLLPIVQKDQGSLVGIKQDTESDVNTRVSRPPSLPKTTNWLIEITAAVDTVEVYTNAKLEVNHSDIQRNELKPELLPELNETSAKRGEDARVNEEAETTNNFQTDDHDSDDYLNYGKSNDQLNQFNDEFKMPDDDFKKWIKEDQFTVFKKMLEDIDINDEFGSYYYSNINGTDIEVDDGSVFYAMENMTIFFNDTLYDDY
ncbi:uncharacterized protein LOC143468124 [Clavelina lepadiformis]|uniref:uncharacterized protein LOC143468124 n=1 Tax=Clavelina lepadiformis TaxID=159417 RepID=UPI0040427839